MIRVLVIAILVTLAVIAYAKFKKLPPDQQRKNLWRVAVGIFLGILGHDIRNTLGAISVSAQVMLRMGPAGEREKMMLNQIRESTERANEIVNSLLDLTRTRLGSGLPITREPRDAGHLGQKIVGEHHHLHCKKH